MTMRVMGIRAELTGACRAVRDDGSFTMDIDGEDFGAEVIFDRRNAAELQVGEHLYVVGRVSFRRFDPNEGNVLVHAERVETLPPPDDADGEAPSDPAT